jgi:CRP-like cAMP-binding protein
MTQAALNLETPARDGLRDRILTLRSQAMFETLDDDGLLLLAEHARSATYLPGEVLAPEGEPAAAFFIIIEGAVELSWKGKPQSTQRQGGAFGALALLAREPSAQAMAVERTRTLEIPAAIFETALDENYSFLRGSIAVFGGLVLQLRRNLPADPDSPRQIREGTYYEEPKTMVQRLIQLRSGSFGYMNVEALIDLARHMVEVRYPAGEVLWSAGDFSTHALHIDYGRVRCTAPDGRHVDIGNDFTIGVLDIWGVRKRAYEVRTLTPVIGFHVAFESFLTLLETHVEVGLEILRGFARDLVAERVSK